MRIASLALIALALLAGCGGDDEPSGATGECESVEAPDPRDPEAREAPTDPLDAGTTYALVVETNCGSFTMTLDQELAPNTTASLVALAEDGYFDDTIFHRVAVGFVIQGGDPTQSGGGGPGYSTVDVPPEGSQYLKGVVAMAKTQTEPPGTSGSQFFVVTAEDAGLPPEYAVVGEVTEGLEVVEAIGVLGDEAQEPTQPIVISSITVSET